MIEQQKSQGQSWQRKQRNCDLQVAGRKSKRCSILFQFDIDPELELELGIDFEAELELELGQELQLVSEPESQMSFEHTFSCLMICSKSDQQVSWSLCWLEESDFLQEILRIGLLDRDQIVQGFFAELEAASQQQFCRHLSLLRPQSAALIGP